jgi:glucose/arabinose dehydrogenase
MCHRRSIPPPSLLATLFAAAVSVASGARGAPGGENPAFTFEVVDTTRHAGYYAALAFGPGGVPAVSYQEGERLDLWYAERTGGPWQTRAVSTALETGFVSSLAFDQAGEPLISFDSPIEHYVRLARRQGGNWSSEPVDYTRQGFTSSTALAIDSQNRPWIAYQKMSEAWIAHRDGSGWVLDLVDDDGITGWFPSMVLHQDAPHLSYGHVTESRIRYARPLGTGWDMEIADPGPVGAATYTSLAFSPGGEPAISYRDDIRADLRFTERNAGDWTVTVVDSAGDVGHHTSLAFDSAGEPWIAYLDRGAADLLLAHRASGAWTIERVDTTGRVGSHASLRFDPQGHAMIAYLDATNGALKLARRVDPAPGPRAESSAALGSRAGERDDARGRSTPHAPAADAPVAAVQEDRPTLDACAVFEPVPPERAERALANIPAGFSDVLVAHGFDQPTAFCLVPGGRALVTERRTGLVRLVQNDAIHASDPAGAIDSVRSGTNEEGLVGIALDPRFPAHPYAYVSYDWSGGPLQRVERFTLVGDLVNATDGALALDPTSVRAVLPALPDSNVAHNVGGLRFDRDSMLVIAVGDDGTKCASQDLTSMRGKLLRIDIRGIPAGPGAAPPLEGLAPPDNPWASHPDPRARLVWQNGLRNPFSFSLDPMTDEAFIADVGQIVYEELDHASSPGMNFGWPHHEGPMPTTFHCVEADTTNSAPPIAGYFYPPGPRTIISAGVYRRPFLSPGFPAEYEGNVFYVDFYLGAMKRLRRTASGFEPAPPVAGQPNATDWLTGLEYPVFFDVRAGAIWYLEMFSPYPEPGSGELRRLSWIPTTDAGPSPKPFQLAPPRPSPARGPITVVWTLSHPARAEVVVRDLAGRFVRTLHAQRALEPGQHERVWDGHDASGSRAAPGLYIVELRVEGQGRSSRTVALLR